MAKISEIVAQNPWWRDPEFVTHDQTLRRAEPIFFERKEINLRKENIYILR